MKKQPSEMGRMKKTTDHDSQSKSGCRPLIGETSRNTSRSLCYLYYCCLPSHCQAYPFSLLPSLLNFLVFSPLKTIKRGWRSNSASQSTCHPLHYSRNFLFWPPRAPVCVHTSTHTRQVTHTIHMNKNNNNKRTSKRAHQVKASPIKDRWREPTPKLSS